MVCAGSAAISSEDATVIDFFAIAPLRRLFVMTRGTTCLTGMEVSCRSRRKMQRGGKSGKAIDRLVGAQVRNGRNSMGVCCVRACHDEPPRRLRNCSPEYRLCYGPRDLTNPKRGEDSLLLQPRSLTHKSVERTGNRTQYRSVHYCIVIVFTHQVHAVEEGWFLRHIYKIARPRIHHTIRHKHSLPRSMQERRPYLYSQMFDRAHNVR